MKTSLLILCSALLASAGASSQAADPGRVSLDRRAYLNHLIDKVDGTVTFTKNLVLERMDVPVPYLYRNEWNNPRGVLTKPKEMPALKVELPSAEAGMKATNCFLALDSESDKVNLSTNGAKARLTSDPGENASPAEADYYKFRVLHVKMHFADRDRQALITCDLGLSLRALQAAFAEKGIEVQWSKLPAIEEKYVQRIEVQDLNEADAR